MKQFIDYVDIVIQEEYKILAKINCELLGIEDKKLMLIREKAIHERQLKKLEKEKEMMPERSMDIC